VKFLTFTHRCDGRYVSKLNGQIRGGDGQEGQNGDSGTLSLLELGMFGAVPNGA
jgi:hypothetical protein